jgi:pyrroloquinoline quinone (PQQ) biosynthesis protein C
VTMPYDGRSRPIPEYEPGALSPEEFEAEFCDALVSAQLEFNERDMLPFRDLTPEQARRYHATFLKYLSFFAWKFPSWLMAVASLCPYQDVRKDILEDCWDEEVGDVDAEGACHIDVLYEEAEVCGINRQEIFDTFATPPIFAAVNAFENLARTLPWHAGFSAVGALEIINSEPALKARERLDPTFTIEAGASALGGQSFHEILGVPDGSLKFLALHAYKDRFHGGGELALVVKYATTRSAQKEALWAARASMQIMSVMSKEMQRLCMEAAAEVG